MNLNKQIGQPERYLFVGKKHLFAGLCLFAFLFYCAAVKGQVLGDPPDVSQDFQKAENVYFIGNQVTKFDAATGAGEIRWNRYLRNTTL